MKGLLAGGVVVAVALATAACSASVPAHHPHHSSPAAVQTQAAAPAPPLQPAAEASWEQNSPGYQSWLDVGSDINQLNQDLSAGDSLAIYGVGGIGFKLAEASGAALQNPSPVSTDHYKKAMGNFGLMGVALTNGNETDAATFASKALKNLRAWAAAAQPGASGNNGCGDWNLPQSSNCGTI